MSALPDDPPPYATVAFDVDSTLSAIEGIDELAAMAGVDVRSLTERAMRGEIPLESVYRRRLEAVRPTRTMLDALGAKYVERALPHARELVAALRDLGKRVAIVSGALEPAVRALARDLGVPDADVFAVGIAFDARGDYAGFDETSPLARSGGKVGIVRALSAARAGGLALVGDGMTDLEAAPERGRFVAFGGVARREPVFAAARVACERADLAALVPLLLSPEEIARLARGPAHAGLVRASG